MIRHELKVSAEVCLTVYWHLLLFFLTIYTNLLLLLRLILVFYSRLGLFTDYLILNAIFTEIITTSLFCMILFHLSGFAPSNFSLKRTKLEIIRVWNIDFFLPPCMLLMCRHMVSFEWFVFCQFAPEFCYGNKTPMMFH